MLHSRISCYSTQLSSRSHPWTAAEILLSAAFNKQRAQIHFPNRKQYSLKLCMGIQGNICIKSAHTYLRSINYVYFPWEVIFVHFKQQTNFWSKHNNLGFHKQWETGHLKFRKANPLIRSLPSQLHLPQPLVIQLHSLSSTVNSSVPKWGAHLETFCT